MDAFRHLLTPYHLPDHHAGDKTKIDMRLQSFWKVNKLNKNHSYVWWRLYLMKYKITIANIYYFVIYG